MNDAKRPGAVCDDLVEERRDRLGELVQVAAGDRKLPPEIVERALAVVHTNWNDDVSQRRQHRRRWIWGSVAAAAVFAVAVFSALRLFAPTDLPPILALSVDGSVSVDSGGATPSALQAGSPVPVGARLRTATDGRVALLLPSGYSVRLDTHSGLRIASAAEVQLERGALYVDSGGESTPAAGGLAVRTNFGTVRDVGTQFMVRDEQTSLRIRVREGRVRLDGPQGRHEIETETELILDEQGRVTRSEILPYGSEWDWVDRITPTMEIAGRTLREFLDWISRERGLRLVFSDPQTARSAERIVLNGSVAGLSPDDALMAVLPTCGMTRTVESGILLIRSETEPDR